MQPRESKREKERERERNRERKKQTEKETERGPTRKLFQVDCQKFFEMHQMSHKEKNVKK